MDHSDQAHHEPTTLDKVKLATRATADCLLGCGIGEVVGVIIGKALAMTKVHTIELAVILGFVFALAPRLIPLLKTGMALKDAVRKVLIAQGLSIVVMEAAEVAVEVYMPGVMQAELTSGLFWDGMCLALLAGFVAAFPVNYVLVGRALRHAD